MFSWLSVSEAIRFSSDWMNRLFLEVIDFAVATEFFVESISFLSDSVLSFESLNCVDKHFESLIVL